MLPGASFLAGALLAGCGLQATPQPPSLKLPVPVTDLSGGRAGDEVSLHWTMPKRDTDKVVLKGDQRVRVCRRIATGTCDTAAELLLAPAAKASFVDHLPAALTVGTPRLLVYTVVLENHAGHDAGPSNAVYTESGAAPARLEGFTAAAAADGVVLRWKPVSGETGAVVRIHRTLFDNASVDSAGSGNGATAAGKNKPKQDEAAGSPPPVEQTLEVDGDRPDAGGAVDRDAVLDHVYRYSAERVRKLTVEAHAFEVASAASEVLTLNARDIFAPAVPVGLQAVADGEARAIDLSWTPNTEADLAGYIVYRREAGSVANPVRVSPPGLVSPAFRDASALPGHHYAYSVSAVDRDGNESARSGDVEEELP
jgi:hypothetical protein